MDSSTRIPRIREFVKEYFPDLPNPAINKEINLYEAVTYGARIDAKKLSIYFYCNFITP